MANSAENDIGKLYDFIMARARLEEYVVAKSSPSLGAVSFFELDKSTRTTVSPRIENMHDTRRDQARFMLDVSLLNLLRKRKAPEALTPIAVDMHLPTLAKTAFRTRYLVVLGDFIQNYGHDVLLNIKSVPARLHTTKLGDLLRYLIPITKNVALQVNSENILGQDLKKTSAKYITLSVRELARINSMAQRDMVRSQLSKMQEAGKEIIVRNDVEPVARKQAVVQKREDAFYL